MDECLTAHVPRVYRFVLNLTRDEHYAEDITQETFVRAWKQRRRLRWSNESTRVWLFRTAHNLWRDQLRRVERKNTALSAQTLELPCKSGTETGSAEACREQAHRILDAMARLPERQREVLHLIACETMSVEDVSRVLGISPEATRASLSLARKRIRGMLDDLES